VPKTTKSGKAKQDELPSTLRRSPAKAQRTFAKAHDSAAEEYGEGERAHRTAYAAVKQKFEKVGDHWERKGGGRSGPSDSGGRGSAGGTRGGGSTKGGVDANAPKSELYDIAKRLDISGRSKMSKSDLVDAIQKENGRRTRASRRS
jgi:cation transport regulator ChaB